MRKFTSLWIIILLSAIKCVAVERADTLPTDGDCRFSLRRTVVGASLSIVINASLTELLKDNIRAKLPD